MPIASDVQCFATSFLPNFTNKITSAAMDYTYGIQPHYLIGGVDFAARAKPHDKVAQATTSRQREQESGKKREQESFCCLSRAISPRQRAKNMGKSV
jgi:hypothetical protein